MARLLVIDAVGLVAAHVARMPFLSGWAAKRQQRRIQPMLPALTCSVQATYLTGVPPALHGIVGNGWYFRDLAEVSLWKQSYHLVQTPYLWHDLKKRKPGFTVCNTGWWFNMYSGADYSVTPRPQYRANGFKIPDCYTEPANWREELQQELGQFPLFHYWGPRTTIKSSDWLAKAAMVAERKWKPDLNLVYLPHLDYNLQRRGDPHLANDQDLTELDTILKDLITEAESHGLTVLLLSEYGIGPVEQPVHLNRVLRQAGYLTVREENGRELLDAGASRAFAVADHQVAHVYVKDPADIGHVKVLLEGVAGVAEVLDEAGKTAHGLNHARSGELVALAQPKAWFTYYYWLEDARAPDFARMVEIHRKPGYDPVELFADPAKPFLMLRVAGKLALRKLGFRTIMDIIPLDASLVKGSHGIIHPDDAHHPVIIGPAEVLTSATFQATEIRGLMEKVLLAD